MCAVLALQVVKRVELKGLKLQIDHDHGLNI